MKKKCVHFFNECKSKVKPVCCVKAYSGVDVHAYPCLTLLVDERDWSASPTGQLTAREITFNVH